MLIEPEFDRTKFSAQLAQNFFKKADNISDEQEFVVTQKLDGFRCLAKIEDQQVTLFTRNGKIYDNLPVLKDAIQSLNIDNVYLDGELLLNLSGLTTHDLFQETSLALQAEENQDNMTYNIFDMVPLHEFEANHFTQDYWTRRQQLNQLGDNDYVKILPVLAHGVTKEDIPHLLTQAVNNDWEGIMLNKPQGIYRKKRSNDLLKVKQMHTADLLVKDFTIKNNEVLAIKLEYKGHLISTGSGITDALSNSIIQNPEQYIDRIAEIKYFEEYLVDGIEYLRFPSLEQFRFDKNQDDVNID